MSKNIIECTGSPAAIGPYSQAVQCNGMLFVSGQVPIDVSTGKLVEGGIREQTAQVLRNIGAILREAGYDYPDVVKTTCLLSDMELFKEMNEIYSGFFPQAPPARCTFAVRQLPLQALVEIEVIAVR